MVYENAVILAIVVVAIFTASVLLLSPPGCAQQKRHRRRAQKSVGSTNEKIEKIRTVEIFQTLPFFAAVTLLCNLTRHYPDGAFTRQGCRRRCFGDWIQLARRPAQVLLHSHSDSQLGEVNGEERRRWRVRR